MKVAVFGTRKLGYDGLKALIASHHEVVLVVVGESEITEGYPRVEYEKLCREKGIICRHLLSQADMALLLEQTGAEVGISLYWRRLFGERVTSVPKHGFINVHCGPLPRYRGFASSVWQMLDGSNRAYVSIHEIVPGEADSGAVLREMWTRIEETATIQEVHDALFEDAIDVLPNILDQIADGRVVRSPQTATPHYSYPRLPQDGLIDWSQPAKKIDLLIRAVGQPYPGAFTFLTGRNSASIREPEEIAKIIIWRAHVLKPGRAFSGVPGHIVKNDEETGESWVLTGKGILVLEEIEVAGSDKTHPAGNFFHSVQLRLGNPRPEITMRLQERVKLLEAQMKSMAEAFRAGAAGVEC